MEQGAFCEGQKAALLGIGSGLSSRWLWSGPRCEYLTCQRITARCADRIFSAGNTLPLINGATMHYIDEAQGL